MNVVFKNQNTETISLFKSDFYRLINDLRKIRLKKWGMSCWMASVLPFCPTRRSARDFSFSRRFRPGILFLFRFPLFCGYIPL